MPLRFCWLLLVCLCDRTLCIPGLVHSVLGCPSSANPLFLLPLIAVNLSSYSYYIELVPNHSGHHPLKSWPAGMGVNLLKTLAKFDLWVWLHLPQSTLYYKSEKWNVTFCNVWLFHTGIYRVSSSPTNLHRNVLSTIPSPDWSLNGQSRKVEQSLHMSNLVWHPILLS